MSENKVRSAIGAALDYPFAEKAFALVDLIEIEVRDGEPGGELHEVAAEITERLIEGPLSSTQTLAVLWAVLGADGAAVENFGDFDPDASTLDRVRLDVWTVVERAVFAGLEAFAEEASTEPPFAIVDLESATEPGEQYRVVYRFATAELATAYLGAHPDQEKVARGGFAIDGPES